MHSHSHSHSHSHPNMHPRTTPRRAAAILGLLVLGGTTACSTVGASDGGDENQSAAGTVVLVTHDSFAIGKPLKAAFEEESGLTLEIRQPGDAGTLTNQLVLTKDSPLGDAVFGIDNAFAERALQADILEPYAPPGADDVIADLDVDDTDRVTPVDFGDVCINVDQAWFAEQGLAEPATLEDLADPAYEDLLVVTDPATSSPGLAFLLATVGAYGDDWTDYWSRLRDNGVAVADSWSDAYYLDFSGAQGDGPRPLVLSYASSPPYTVPKGADEPTTRALLETCFRQVEYTGVIAGAENPEGAQELVDFLLSDRFQQQIPKSMYVYPAVEGTPLPPVWERFAPLADEPYQVSPDEIAANREEWIREWTATVVD